jgi:hypothetical protein
MSNETFASERSGSGLRWRNVATVAALFALLSVMALTTPLAEQWVRDQRARQAAAPNPVIPDAQEASAIAFLVLEGLHFDGVPPPPPAPGESGESLNRRPLVIEPQSIGFGSATQGPRPDSMTAEYLAGPMLDEFVPRKFREELVLANHDRQPLDLSGLPDLIPVHPADVEKVLAGNGWDAFYEIWPDTAGLVRMSRAVLSTDRQQALIFVEFRCASMCGHGDIYLLSRTDTGWRIVGRRNAWMS